MQPFMSITLTASVESFCSTRTTKIPAKEIGVAMKGFKRRHEALGDV
jgi:hypothetical protein